MRYYTIQIINPKTGKSLRIWSSFPGGQTDPNALDIELDIPVTYYATPQGSPYIRIWGISFQDINQSANFNGMSVAIYGGMQKGLPLSNPRQAALLATGTIQQAFANWIGTEMTLDLIFTAGNFDGSSPINLTTNWKAGTSLSSAISQTLTTSFPTYQQKIDISPNLVLSNDEPGFHGSLIQLATYVKNISKSVIGGSSYRGVDILLRENTFYVTDGTTIKSPKEILFTDLVGQVTWIASGIVQVTCVMRGDLQVGDYIKMPAGQVTIQQQSYSQYRDKSAFQGVFLVTSVRHLGRYRNASGLSWISILDAAGPVPDNG